MVGASSVAISPDGKLTIVTMQDTNNLGLLNTTLSNDLRGYQSDPGFQIDYATGRTINGLYLDYLPNFAEPVQLNASWLAPRRVRFAPSGELAFVGMSGGVPNQADKDNRVGVINATRLKAEMRPDGLLGGESPVPVGMKLIDGSELVAPHKVATMSIGDADGDGLSNQLEAFNRWNDYRVVVHGDKNRLAGSDDASIANPADAALPVGEGIDCLGKLFYLPHSGPGYRFEYSGLPEFSANAANRSVVAAVEKIGLLWHRAYLDYTIGKGTGFPVTRPYFVVGHMSQPGGAPLKGLSGEPIHYSSRNGFQVSFPYLKVNSDKPHDFVLSNDPGTPLDNSVTSDDGFDLAHAEALIHYLLAENAVSKISLDPQVLELIPTISESDPKIEVHGSLEIPNTRRDLDSQIIATFGCLEVDLDVDSDNNGAVDGSDDEDDLEGDSAGIGKLVSVNNGDEDDDLIPDYADGFDFYGNEGADASAAFTELVITFPEELDFSRLEFQITYPESSPGELRRVGAGTAEDPYRYVLPDSGYFRIWTKDGNESRLMSEIDAGGDFIASGTRYPASTLTSGLSVTVYVEAVTHTAIPSNNDFVIEIFANDESHSVFSLKDTVNITAGPFIEFVDNEETHDGQDMLPLFNPAPYVVLDPIPDPGTEDNPAITVSGTVTSYIAPLAKEDVFVNGLMVASLTTDGINEPDGPDGLGPFKRRFVSESMNVGNTGYVILAWAVNCSTAYGADTAYILTEKEEITDVVSSSTAGSEYIEKSKSTAIVKRNVINGGSIPKKRVAHEDNQFRIKYVNLNTSSNEVQCRMRFGDSEQNVTLEKISDGIYESKQLALIPDNAVIPETVSQQIKDSLFQADLGHDLKVSIELPEYTGEDNAILVGLLTKKDAENAAILEVVKAHNRAYLNDNETEINDVEQFHIEAGVPGNIGGRNIQVDLSSYGRDDRELIPQYSSGFPATDQLVTLLRQSNDPLDPLYNLYRSEKSILALSQALPPDTNTENFTSQFVLPGGFLDITFNELKGLNSYAEHSNKEYVAGIMAFDLDGDTVEGVQVSNPVPVIEIEESEMILSQDKLSASIRVKGNVRDPIADMYDLPALDFVKIYVQGEEVNTSNLIVEALPEERHVFAPFPKKINFELSIEDFYTSEGINSLTIEAVNGLGNINWASSQSMIRVELPEEIGKPYGPSSEGGEGGRTGMEALAEFITSADVSVTNHRIEDGEIVKQKFYPENEKRVKRRKTKNGKTKNGSNVGKTKNGSNVGKTKNGKTKNGSNVEFKHF